MLSFFKDVCPYKLACDKSLLAKGLLNIMTEETEKGEGRESDDNNKYTKELTKIAFHSTSKHCAHISSYWILLNIQ